MQQSVPRAMIREKLTYEDYVRIPADGLRHEIIDGVHYVSAAPVLRHQKLAGRIFRALSELEDAGAAQVFIAPVDCHLSEFDIVQPDVVAIPKGGEDILCDKKVNGPPGLVVEVLSPSTARIDRGIKLELYARVGVPEYWVVDGEQDVLTSHVLRDGRYIETEYCGDVPVPSVVFPEFTLDLRKVLER